MIKLPVSKSGRGALEIASAVAREAGDILVSAFSVEKHIQIKGHGNLVTDADLSSEKLIIGKLRSEYPGSGITSEESESLPSETGYTWLIDPMDGTNNFSFGIPFFSVCIALVKEDGPLMAITYDPLRQELFHAVEGGGAYLNVRPISVSNRTDLKSGLVGFDIGYEMAKGQEILEVAKTLRPHVFSFRVLGSGALGLAYVSCGRLDIYMHRRLYPWDIASGRLLVVEAGGVVTDWEGKPLGKDSTEIVAGNKASHKEFMGLVR